jgi:hypothetical protein
MIVCEATTLSEERIVFNLLDVFPNLWKWRADLRLALGSVFYVQI